MRTQVWLLAQRGCIPLVCCIGLLAFCVELPEAMGALCRLKLLVGRLLLAKALAELRLEWRLLPTVGTQDMVPRLVLLGKPTMPVVLVEDDIMGVREKVELECNGVISGCF